uniref:Uncharacterized protein n=1 Tax=viral metagenome TaxID=1070528 RepID=A0A6M3KZD5_9ZZZZ
MNQRTRFPFKGKQVVQRGTVPTGQFKPAGTQIAFTDEQVRDFIDIVCAECGGMIFIGAQRVKKISAILSPDGQERYVKLPTVVCLKCQTVLPEKP